MKKIILSVADIASYEKGETAASIARRYQTSPQTVCRRLKEAGIHVRQYPTSLSLLPEDIVEYQSGKTAASIARKRDISPVTVAKYLKKAGIEISRKGSNQHTNPFSLTSKDIDRYRNGESASSIAKRNNTSASAVIRKLKEAKVTTNKLGTNQYPNPFALTDQDILDYQNGESASSIAKKYNIRVTTIVRRLNAAGIQTRPHKQSLQLFHQSNK